MAWRTGALGIGGVISALCMVLAVGLIHVERPEDVFITPPTSLRSYIYVRRQRPSLWSLGRRVTL
jgi:hypothetical protein